MAAHEPTTILFEADGTLHEATVGKPRARPTGDEMLRTVDGVEYQILIRLGGGFFACPVPPAGLQEDLALERLAVGVLEREAESLWRARQYRLALQRRAEAAAARDTVRSLEAVAA